MKIVCPKCGQNYEVDKAQINAETDLECSACNTVFPFTPKISFSSLWYMLKFIAIVVVGTIVVLSCTVGYLMWRSNKVTAELEKNTERASVALKKASEELAKGDELRSNAHLYFERLTQLEKISKTRYLTQEEFREAKSLVKKLEPLGSKEWSSFDVVK